jgi:hypothetical protein
MALKITCPRCRGNGNVRLTGVYLATLKTAFDLLRREPFIVAGRHAEAFGCSPTALNNRLAWLEEHGLLCSTGYGRERRYTR